MTTPGDTGIQIAQPGNASYEQESYLEDDYANNHPQAQSPLEQQFILNSTQRRIPDNGNEGRSSSNAAHLEEIEIQEAGVDSPDRLESGEAVGRSTTYGAQNSTTDDGVDKNASIQIDEEDDEVKVA